MIYDQPINDNNFTIRDNASHFAKYLPEKWIEPLTLISRVEGYRGIDEYILELIKDRLEMFADTRDNLDDDFQKYISNIMKISLQQQEDEEDDQEESNKEENVSDFVRKVHNESTQKFDQQKEEEGI
jgi:hypothetical protein